ncbi:MAG: DUF2341 domain-containing protein, partial [Anaerolineaceae bacterium]
SANGTSKLDHEIEKYAPSTGELVAWVEVPSLSGSVNTILYMYYGNGTVADQWNINGTWDEGGSGTFEGVWHLNETVSDETTTFGTHLDSTSNSNHGDQYNNDEVIGQIANGQDFDGTDDYIDVSSFAGITGYPITISVWSAATTGSNGSFRAAGTVGLADDQYYGVGWSDTTGQTELAARNTSFEDIGGPVIGHDDWTHIVGVFENATNRRLYVNGSLANSDSVSVPELSNPTIFQMGQILNGADGFMQVDEARISSSVRQLDWISTEYNNQNSPSSFYGLDSPETPGVTPAGKDMNLTQGSGAATLVFDSTDDEAYWYTDLTYPTGGDDASIAAGDYTLNMYFDQLPQVPADWYDADWAYRKKITIDSSLVTANIINFPVLISLTSDSNLANDAQNDGDDILFTSSNGTTKLSHEIESFNDSSGELQAWVKTNLSSISDTELYMYYGNGSVGSQEDVANVWTNGYIGVWHLDETGSPVSDSTTPSYDGTVTGASPNSSAYINGAFDFVRAEDDEIEMFGTASTLSFTDFTVEAWLHTPDSSIPDDYYAVTQSLYCDGNESWVLNIADDISHEDEARFAIKESGTQTSVFGSVITDNQWHYVAGVRTSTQLLIYVDDAAPNSIADNRPGETILSSANISIGAAICNETEDYNGTIDEVRISDSARNEDWIDTTYNNQANQGVGAGKFIKSLGSEETLPSVDITVSVHHTSSDGSDPQEIITSSTVTIDANTTDPYALSIGSGSEQTFTSADPRRVRAFIDVTAVNGGGSFTLAYDSAADPSSLDTPSIVVPDVTSLLVAVVIFIPILMNLFIKRRRLALRIVSFVISILAVMTILGQQVIPVGAAPDTFYLHDTDSGSNPAWYDPDWSYRKKITIYASEVSADLDYFPVLINQSSDT